MSISALVQGTLFRGPEARSAKNGNSFITATIRETSGAETRWINVLAFGELAQAKLIRLRPGDHISVQGPLTASVYERNNGVRRVNLTVIADAILSFRRAGARLHPSAPPRNPPASCAKATCGATRTAILMTGLTKWRRSKC
jgi:single-stranded DNA-binding protein